GAGAGNTVSDYWIDETQPIPMGQLPNAPMYPGVGQVHPRPSPPEPPTEPIPPGAPPTASPGRVPPQPTAPGPASPLRPPPAAHEPPPPPEPAASASRPRREPSLARSSRIMALASAASRLTGFLRSLAIAAAIGLELVGDAYNTANTLPNIVYDLLLGGVLTSVVVPLLVHAQERDADRGEAYTQRLLCLATTA